MRSQSSTPTRALIDGEIVVENEGGISDFSALQDELKTGRIDRFVYYVFDLMHLDGADLTREAADRAQGRARKSCSRAPIATASSATASISRTSGTEMLRARLQHAARRRDVEAARCALPVRPRTTPGSSRSVGQNQEFVIVGYKDATHLKGAVGALVLGYYEDGKLHYAGRSGTGYSMETARDLWKKLQPLRRDDAGVRQDSRRKSAAARASGSSRSWSPKIDFRGWTGAEACAPRGVQGLREDKPATEIVRETPMADESESESQAAPKTAKRAAQAKPKAKPTPAPVKFTHPDRVYWTDVEHHQAAARRLLHRRLGSDRAASW